MFSDVLINEVNDLFANFFAFDDLSANGGSYATHNPDSSFATWRIREGGIVADHVQGVLYDPVEGRQSEFIASGFPDGQGGVFGVGNARLLYKDSSDQLLVNEMTFDVLSVNAVSLQAVSEPRTLAILSLCILGLVARKRAKANNWHGGLRGTENIVWADLGLGIKKPAYAGFLVTKYVYFFGNSIFCFSDGL